jgi:ech hydrogenase subunit D
MIEANPLDLINEAFRLSEKSARLVQICCTSNNGQELTYSFEADGKLEHLRLSIDAGEQVPSITSLFSPAFTYENEMRELFGVNIVGIEPDFKGNFYKTSNPSADAASNAF